MENDNDFSGDFIPDENDKEQIDVLVTEINNDFLKSGSAIQLADGRMFYYMPFYFEETEKGFLIHSLSRLPKELAEYITKARLGGPHNPTMPHWADEVKRIDDATNGKKD